MALARILGSLVAIGLAIGLIPWRKEGPGYEVGGPNDPKVRLARSMAALDRECLERRERMWALIVKASRDLDSNGIRQNPESIAVGFTEHMGTLAGESPCAPAIESYVQCRLLGTSHDSAVEMWPLAIDMVRRANARGQ